MAKQYTSIIRLFDHCGISAGDDFNLSRAKKQLQAEFGIAQGGFIETGGYTYTRQDVFEEIEHADFARRFVFHKQVWNSPHILQVLEKNTIDFAAVRNEIKPFCGNKEFDEFFSPYFAGPFSYLSRVLLAESKLKETGELLSYEEFLQPAEREEAFRPIRIYLDENFKLLRNVNGENYKIMRPNIIQWIDTDWYKFFNNLPHEFYDIKNDITTKLINIGVAVQKKHRADCKKMSYQLIALGDTPESLRSTIVSNHQVYTGSSRSFSWRGGFWVFWIIIMLMKGVLADGCGANSTTPDFKYADPNEIKFQVPDTVFKRIKDSTNKFHKDTNSLLIRHDRFLR